MSKIYEYYMDRQKSCPHTKTEYIPPEPDINDFEAMICEDCGMDLPLHSPGDLF